MNFGMRLLINFRPQLLGQHRNVALRGNGWGRRHATVDMSSYSPYRLFMSIIV